MCLKKVFATSLMPSVVESRTSIAETSEEPMTDAAKKKAEIRTIFKLEMSVCKSQSNTRERRDRQLELK